MSQLDLFGEPQKRERPPVGAKRLICLSCRRRSRWFMPGETKAYVDHRCPCGADGEPIDSGKDGGHDDSSDSGGDSGSQRLRR